ncbi:Alpha-L-fucosidase [Microbacterium sp. 8M]|uniref:alpha-L-fucosidase n=1 Tax=Microbacterium sp. 8M TaxID=2653153 RepID=UPI0012F2C4B7|nr:alpha-L-fucosidase [Microbacterium sp. 8M]VXB08801.1 Alpha-L-fucosidase [Microbacterium sp. 8M]
MIALRYGAGSQVRRDDPAMRAFRADRFGQFVHWGLYALPAGTWKGRTIDFAAEFLMHSAHVSRKDWAALAAEFTLEGFDPVEWARTAKAMGARYVTVTTKHHDGFCLWPSAYSDFTVAATPSGRDVLGEIIEAYQAEGLAVHLYYSVLDWHHPDWRYALETDDDRAAFDRYLEFATDQLVELAERYPQVRGFWFDGTWDASVKANGRWTCEIERILKERIPGAIVNSRLRADDLGARHFDSNGALMGDYESGYERRLPAPWDLSVTAHDWEACATITQATWGFHDSAWADSGRKSPAQIVEQLAQTVSLGGNLLLNFGPRGDGSLVPAEVELAREVGAWMDVNSAAVHASGPANGWEYPGWGFYTAPLEPADASDTPAEPAHGAGVVHAVVTRIPVSGVLPVELPPGVEVRSIRALADGADVPFTVLDGRSLRIPAPASAGMPVVFALELGAAGDDPALREPNPDVALV